MHEARAFFFVCAGIFLLALSYHLGARSAGAQSVGTGPFLVAGDRTNSTPWLACPNGDVLLGNVVMGNALTDHPGRSMTSLAQCGPYLYVVLDDGSFLVGTDGGGGWRFYEGGTLSCGSATPAQSISIGQLKAKYAK